MFSQNNKRLFTQIKIKIGERKTIIVAILAVINALREKYVNVLTSSEVLTERDSKERKKLNEMFGLNVTNAKNENFRRYEIVYGDSLSFEGGLLRNLLKKILKYLLMIFNVVKNV